MAEQITIVQQTFFSRLVQQGVECAQIAADAVLLQSAVDEPCLILLYHVGCEFLEWQIHILTKILETPIGIVVCAGCALSFHQRLLGDLFLQEHEYGLVALLMVEGFA